MRRARSKRASTIGGWPLATVESKVKGGATGMPAFGDQLSDTQIKQVSQFVAMSSQ